MFETRQSEILIYFPVFNRLVSGEYSIIMHINRKRNKKGGTEGGERNSVYFKQKNVRRVNEKKKNNEPNGFQRYRL